MRRAAVLGLLCLPLLVATASGCDEGSGARDASTTPERGARSSGSEERLRRARREMGLADLAREDSDADELPFELGTERLPEMPHEVDPEGDALREGLALAVTAFALARPEPEGDLDRPGYQTFVEEDYARWLAERGQALGAARRALARAERGEVGEYAVASAVIGLLFARFAESIATMTLPAAIESVPADRLRFRDAFLRAAAPLFDRAADAFGACASATVRTGDATLGPWQRYCDERLERAQDAPRPID
jgi:hypothetical protein